MRAINVLLSLAVCLVLGLAVFELGLRLIGKGPTPTINRFDPAVGWVKKPDQSITRSGPGFAIGIETNALGLRDDPMDSAAKAAGAYRVLALGDSFTLGYTVEREQCFVDLIEDGLARSDARAEVLNVGTEGHSTDQEVAWYLEHGAAFGADLVLLFPYENDLFWNTQTSYTRFPKPRFARSDGPDAGRLEPRELADPGPAPLVDRWAVLKLVKPLVAAPAPPPLTLGPGGRELPSEAAVILEPPPPFWEEARARTASALIALRDAAAARGAKLVVAPIPSKELVHAAARAATCERFHLPASSVDPDRPVRAYLDLCAELGIASIDARAALVERGRTEPLYFDVYPEFHFNAAGNAVFAEAVLAGLAPHVAAPGGAGASAPLAAAASAGGVPTWAIVFAALWLALSTGYTLSYPDEKKPLAALKILGMLAAIFAIFLGLRALIGAIPPAIGRWVAPLFVVAILGFVVWKLGRRVTTILELFKAFALRGHWYLMPAVVVLLSIGGLLVVAASSPFVAPFIYTLF